jgi:hypothetical protein
MNDRQGRNDTGAKNPKGEGAAQSFESVANEMSKTRPGQKTRPQELVTRRYMLGRRCLSGTPKQPSMRFNPAQKRQPREPYTV